MNKTYRIIWNKARNCLMVVGENAKSQGKGAGNKKTLVTAVTAALLALSGSNALAAMLGNPMAADILITTPTTDPVNLDNGQSIFVDGSGTNTGRIVVGGSAISILNGTSAGAITNSGTISGGWSGIYAYQSTLTGGINNTGSISGGIDGISVYASNLSDGITNSVNGTISGGEDGLAIKSGSTLSGGIYNSGSIIATAINGKAIVLSTSELNGGITNSGTISGGSVGIIALNSTLTGGINNSGSISGGYVGIGSVNSTLSDGINNSGSISGGGIGIFVVQSTLTGGINNLVNGIISGGEDGLAIKSGSTLSGGITNAGLIGGTRYAGINAYQSALTGGINNSGLISGGSAGIVALSSTLTGGITNSGTISGGFVGIVVASESTLTGGINNSGLISGGNLGIIASSSTLRGGINNSGLISGNGAGIVFASESTLEGGINNSGLISGASVAGILLTGSSLDGGIINTGTISGGIDGLGLRSSTLTGGITNAGLIQGTEYAIYAGQSSSVSGGILVSGTSAQFIGDIYAPNVDLTLDSGAAFTNSNAMSLSGVLVSSGATFNLTNAVSSSSSLSGNINLNSGTGYFTNQGTVDVGSRGASATPTITGNYTQDAGATFKTSVISDTEYGQMYVTGSTTLAGTAYVYATGAATVLAHGGTLAGVITAGDTLSGAFTTINSNSSIYGYTGVYSSNAFGMVVAAQPNAVANDVAQYGTPAASGAAAALDQIATNPGAMAPVIDTLDGKSGQAQANAVEQTLPVIVGAGSMAAAQNQASFNQVVQSRQAQIAGLSSGEAFAGNRDVWGKAFGNWANQGDVNNVSGYSVDGGGLAFGFDKQLSTKSNLGISLAYAYSSVSSNSSVAPSSVYVNSYQAGLYGDYQLQPTWQLNYQLDGAINTNASKRSLSSFAGTTDVGANAYGNYNSYVVHAGLGLQKFLSLNPSTRLTPEVRLDYTTVQTDAYTESGGGLLNLKANSQSYNTLYTSASLRLDHALSNGLNISGNVGIAYNALDNNAQMTSAYQGGGTSFVTNGLDISPWLYNAGVGISGKISKDVELNVRYDIDFSSTSYTNQMVSARVKFLF
jgi:outer membrane autotransporter protein